MPSRIEFQPERQIPMAEGPMALLELGEPAIAGRDLLEEMRDAVAPEAKFEEVEGGGAAAYDGERLVALVNPKTGESNVFPSLERLEPGEGLAERAAAAAKRIASEGSLFPEDATRAVPLHPVTLMGAQHRRDEERSSPQEYLGYVRIQRQVEGAPVWGQGTRAMVAVAGDGAIHGFSHRWREASQTGDRVEPHSHDRIAKAILAQLETVPDSSEVRVDRVMLGYHDVGRKFLQPVYRFEATVISPPLGDSKHKLANRHVFGHVSIGEPPEPLPKLGAKKGKPPKDPPKKGRGEPAKKPPPGDPTVGRYVVRNDSHDWVSSANDFFGGLEAAQGLGVLFGHSIPFTNSQYYWAEPRLFTDEKDSYVNGVQVALNEVHGNWWIFSTRDNQDDLVRLKEIPSSGYGGGNGSLKYWILHSCEVIPTQTDESTSFDVWWDIFNGLHAVVGYRTEMWINDQVTGRFGFLIGLGSAFVPTWLNDIASDDSYDAGTTYFDEHRHIDEPMGRASAVVVCGHSDDIVSQVASLGRAGCLTEWWFDN